MADAPLDKAAIVTRLGSTLAILVPLNFFSMIWKERERERLESFVQQKWIFPQQSKNEEKKKEKGEGEGDEAKTTKPQPARLSYFLGDVIRWWWEGGGH